MPFLTSMALLYQFFSNMHCPIFTQVRRGREKVHRESPKTQPNRGGSRNQTYPRRVQGTNLAKEGPGTQLIRGGSRDQTYPMRVQGPKHARGGSKEQITLGGSRDQTYPRRVQGPGAGE